MDTVIRVAAMYLFLLAVFRLAGKRTLSEATTFDFLMLLVISETTQQALVDDDRSFTNAAILIITFVAMNIGFSLLKQRFKPAERVIEDVPVVVVADGKPLHGPMERERIDEDDILSAARERQGITELEAIRYAVLERDGKISIVPK